MAELWTLGRVCAMVSAVKYITLTIHRPVPLGQIIHYMLTINKYGVPGWLSGVEPLPSAQVMISGSWDQAPHRALYSVGSLLPSLSLSACLSAYL